MNRVVPNHDELQTTRQSSRSSSIVVCFLSSLFLPFLRNQFRSRLQKNSWLIMGTAVACFVACIDNTRQDLFRREQSARQLISSVSSSRSVKNLCASTQLNKQNIKDKFVLYRFISISRMQLLSYKVPIKPQKTLLAEDLCQFHATNSPKDSPASQHQKKCFCLHSCNVWPLLTVWRSLRQLGERRFLEQRLFE